ncbi:hypothetical protein CKO23_03480 [Thiocystis violacea]|nr:flagellar assembly protein FliH [Thiocystis violacea]MBK1721315.1 hypothetical protein [Thiocystis violacea]
MPPDVTLRASQPEVEDVRLPTAEEVAAIEEEARRAGAEAGFREGYQAGYQEGCDKAAREAEVERGEREVREAEQRATQEGILAETVGALEAIAAELADPLASAVDALEPELLALVEAVARRVIMAELATRPELIQRVLREALGQLPSRHHAVRLYVHPDQQAVLESYAEHQGEDISWVPEPGMEPGGCVLESGPSRIDASLDARLRQAVEAIWGDLERPSTGLEAESRSDEPRPDAIEAPDAAVEPTERHDSAESAQPPGSDEPSGSNEPSGSDEPREDGDSDASVVPGEVIEPPSAEEQP